MRRIARRLRHEDWIREFPDRAFRRMFASRVEFQSLLGIVRPELAGRTRLDRRGPRDPSRVSPQHRERRGDLFHKGDYRAPGAPRRRVRFPFEHQSSIDLWMPVRFHWRAARMWDDDRQESPRPPIGALSAIVPVLLYSGAKPWPPRPRGWPDPADPVADYLPATNALVLDLKHTPEARFLAVDRTLGAALIVFAREKAPYPRFAEALEAAARELGQQRAAERGRRDRLLAFLVGIVLNRRPPREHGRLLRVIESTIRPEMRREVSAMQETIDYLIRRGEKKGEERGLKKGEERGLKKAVESAIREKFGRVPRDLAAEIRSTTDQRRLDRWLKRVLRASSLEELRLDRSNGRG